MIFRFALLVIISLLLGCRQQPEKAVHFKLLKAGETGIHFSNKLAETPEFNVFKYLYFYNGAGVGAADLNNDGLIDLFFASNQGANKIYLNKGSLKFEDITASTGIPDDGAWSTGVSITDINNDGLADIYVCRVSQFLHLTGHNLMLICTGIDKNGIPHYKDQASELGLAFSGFSTQAAFLDYDLDGDLDMYLLNHSIHENGGYGPRAQRLNDTVSVSGDRFFRNDNNHFTDVTRSTGIYSSVLGFGLGMAIADINLDGYPDVYVGNDFHENDYLYINQKDGTFKEETNNSLMHTSKYTMGVDIADVNNDALPDIFSLDMLPFDPYILKRSEGDDRWDNLKARLNNGYNVQYTRNNLQFNRGNNKFSEVGLYAGVGATDWSWSALLMDFDNDGRKDLFISNGIPKRLNDIDYVSYASNNEIQAKIKENNLDEQDLALTGKFPQIKIPNIFFRNEGNLRFTNLEEGIAGDMPSFSNGATYADLDNDGDLDIVVNNLEEEAFVYENTLNNGNEKNYLELKLKGPATNITATGAKVYVYTKDSVHSYEYQPVRGFLSSMLIPLHIGIKNLLIDSINVVWPNNTYQRFDWRADTAAVIKQLNYRDGLPPFSYESLLNLPGEKLHQFTDITKQTGIDFTHRENNFNEFSFEPLLPHMTSTEGPALTVGDINNDGLDDMFIGAAKGSTPAVFIQLKGGKFEKLKEPALEADALFESVDACLTDVNNDGFKDLVIGSGGNEFTDPDFLREPRLYLNNGKGLFSRNAAAFSGVYATASTVQPCDFNRDGFVDLFLGARREPWQYGLAPQSYLLLNDKTGNFKDVTQQYAPDIAQAGMIAGASWVDLDNDGDSDLVAAVDWQGILAFVNDGRGHFSKKALTEKTGWWNFVTPFDIDNDGDMDLVAGNLGLNSRLQASVNEPVNLYINDFDNNGNAEEVLTYYPNNQEVPFADKVELQTQLPKLKKNYLYAADFAKEPLNDLFGKEALSEAKKLSANYFSNAILINDGNLNFSLQGMPWQAQLTCYRDAVELDANNDGRKDILLVGNYFESNTQMGRYDADYGTILLNTGNHRYKATGINGVALKGQSRRIRPITIAGKKAFIIARNNDSLMVIQ